MAARSCGRKLKRTSINATLSWRAIIIMRFASAAYQIGIVLASAAVITGIMALVYAAMGLGIIGLAFVALGFFNPHYLHSLHLI